MSTTDLATDLARCTVWTRANWLEALASVPAGVADDPSAGRMIADVAAAYGRSPSSVVEELWPKRRARPDDVLIGG